ncbi:MAG: hypothetical protein HGB12_10600 [Bacteroidetes bacterium]|nr:hypothetical protein [Bacteroidota bacterium]
MKLKEFIYKYLFVLFSLELFGFLFLIYWSLLGEVFDTWFFGWFWTIKFVGAVLAGLGFGIFAGNIAWRKIYIEGVRGKKYIINK